MMWYPLAVAVVATMLPMAAVFTVMALADRAGLFNIWRRKSD